MFMSQKRIIPRWKEWKPLATQQFRLRNLIQIIGINVGAEDLEGKIYKTPVDKNQSRAVSFYYTLHLTAMSAPFYTSERLESDCPKWKEIDASLWTNAGVFGGTQGFIFRLWCNSVRNETDEILSVWGVHLTGLVYLGTNLSSGCVPEIPNTIIFLLPGGYYTMMKDSERVRVSSMKVGREDLRQSYNLSMVYRLTAIQKSIALKFAQVEAIKLKISTGDFATSENRGSATLRRILNQTRAKSNPQDITKLKESIELAKFFCQTLEEEKASVFRHITQSRSRLENLSDKNQLKESQTMEKYRLLQREVQAHRQWLVGHIHRREAQIHAKAQLNFRIKELISQLQLIYPVERQGDKLTICGVYLPDSENLAECDDLKVSVGLGFVAHTVQMASIFSLVPLRYPVIHFGSRSRILDLIADKMPDSEREFPLFSKGKDKLQFNYAVYLLNKNIAALRCIHGLSTRDLRCTLLNLEGLLRLSEIGEAPPQSPNSPGVDIASSSLSISSPIQSHSFPRKYTWHRLSESSNAGPVAVDVTNSLTNNLSYSLDKGLNELKALARNAQRLACEKQVSNATNLPSAGSESNLPSSPANDSSLLCVAEDASTSTYLKTWDVDKGGIFSDTDSDQNCVDDKTANLLIEKDEKIRRDSDCISVGLEACDIPVGAPLEAAATSDTVTHGGDALLDNVTDRTEALANQASSFNMFRPRFRSTLEDAD